MQRYKVTVEYLGTAFYGFQAQPNVPTVQVELEKAFARLVGEGNLSRVIVSSRTDAGVHAVENVCHVDLQRIAKWSRKSNSLVDNVPTSTNAIHPSAHPCHVVQNAINSFLREKKQPIVVKNVEAVSQEFHSRYHACGREYIYQIYTPGNTRPSHPRIRSQFESSTSVFTRDTAWHFLEPLDLEAMSAACVHFQGKHDFTSFRGVKCQAASPIRHLESLEVIDLGMQSNVFTFSDTNLHLLHVKACAPSFLYHMVRNIVGTLVAVGTHKLKPHDIIKLIEAKNRQLVPPMAPAQGLYLTKVKYPSSTTNSNAPTSEKE